MFCAPSCLTLSVRFIRRAWFASAVGREQFWQRRWHGRCTPSILLRCGCSQWQPLFSSDLSTTALPLLVWTYFFNFQRFPLHGTSWRPVRPLTRTVSALLFWSVLYLNGKETVAVSTIFNAPNNSNKTTSSSSSSIVVMHTFMKCKTESDPDGLEVIHNYAMFCRYHPLAA